MSLLKHDSFGATPYLVKGRAVPTMGKPLPTRSAQTLHAHLRRVRRLLHITQVPNGLHDVRQDDKRAGQASLCVVQANTKVRGTTQAQKERTTQWNNSTHQT